MNHTPQWQDGWQLWQATPECALHLFKAGGSGSGPTALITAGVHGDEYEGPAALAALARKLQILQRGDTIFGGQILLVPVVNPLARLTGTRITQQDGKNLARCFPGNPDGTVTERLAAAVSAHLLYPADLLIDLHSGGADYTFLPVAGFYGDPGDRNPSFRAARVFGLPALWQLPLTAGVLSCEALKLGKIAIGNEYLGAGQLSRDGVDAYVAGIENCLREWAILPRTSGLDAPPFEAVPCFTGDWICSAVSGLFVSRLELGQEVQGGTLLATIHNERGEVLETLRADSPATVLGLRAKAHIPEGAWAVLLGRRHSIV